jgi:hypothetical protein
MIQWLTPISVRIRLNKLGEPCEVSEMLKLPSSSHIVAFRLLKFLLVRDKHPAHDVVVNVLDSICRCKGRGVRL